ACDKTNALIKEFTAAPIFFSDKNSGGHEWLIEFEKEPSCINYFTEVLDNALKSINSDYEAKRYQDMVLRKPLIKSVPDNTFYNWMKLKGKLGGQHKVPRLYNDRRYIDDILKMIEK
ncbi:MAG TPA: GH3 auxin-responsive promoter family protein, partial [Bacteroidales bacterium]|nr:GH3 auxin-responsive promoter family protein [Bacteroidales bacterium]